MTRKRRVTRAQQERYAALLGWARVYTAAGWTPGGARRPGLFARGARTLANEMRRRADELGSEVERMDQR